MVTSRQVKLGLAPSEKRNAPILERPWQMLHSQAASLVLIIDNVRFEDLERTDRPAVYGTTDYVIVDSGVGRIEGEEALDNIGMPSSQRFRKVAGITFRE